jgi:hypothetical protein
MVEFLERTWWAFAVLLFVTFLSVLGVATGDGEAVKAPVVAQPVQPAVTHKPKKAKPRAAQPAEGDDAAQPEGEESLIDPAVGEDTTPAEERAAAAAAAAAAPPAPAAPAAAEGAGEASPSS